jgi:glycogen debranching enzyme
VGLRTLAPGEPFYQGRYEGGPHQREGAAHNGTARPFLVGYWGSAVLAVLGEGPNIRAKLTRRLASLLKEMETTGCLGTIAEMYDGDEPRLPRGCFAQAWSVAEAIRLHATLKLSRGRRRRRQLSEIESTATESRS